MVLAAVVAVAGLVAFYVASFTDSPPTVAAAGSGSEVDLYLKTEGAVGSQGAHPQWVSYLVRNDAGEWVHSTEFEVPAHALVHVTIYQFDNDSGLRNPFLSRVQGTVGQTMEVDGETLGSIPPAEASHTWAVPQLGIVVPLRGVDEGTPNQCEEGPCSMKEAHETISFTIRTGAPGRYRWQCFVPCAAGFLAAFGGPMQTIGYMDGFLHVV